MKYQRIMLKWSRFFIVFFIVFGFSITTVIAQATDKGKLKNKKTKIQKEIKQMNGLLKEISINKKKSELAFIINQKKINSRQELITSISSEINILDSEYQRQRKSIDALKQQLATYREQYQKMVVYAYKNRNSTNELVFIFSASDFNQAYKRIKYIKEIGEYRQYQAKEINKAQRLINLKIRDLKSKKVIKQQYLSAEEIEKNRLQAEKNENQELLQNLKKDESSLKKKIGGKQKEAQDLDREITRIIQNEIEIARKKAESERKKAEEERRKAEEARKKAATPVKPDKPAADPNKAADPKPIATKQNTKPVVKPIAPKYDATPIASDLSKSFAANQGKFPWPVNTGSVSGSYGIGKHAVFEHLEVVNYGINILTNKGTAAQAIFKGTVIAVILLPSGGKSAVLLQHGEFYTLYSNLITLNVQKGDEVELGTKLGTLKTDEEGKTDIHFEIWKGSEKQNPTLWLKRK